MRVDKKTFEALLARLQEYRLEAERILTAVEKLIHFLYIVGQGSRYRTIKAQFRRLLGTISDSFYTVLTAMLSIYLAVVKEPDYSVVPTRIAENSKFFPFFKDCVSALDSSYIKVYITGESKV